MATRVWQERINRTSLKTARENIGLTSPEATARLFPKNPKGANRVESWESGHEGPTDRQLEKLASLYNVNVFQLLLADDIQPTQPPAAFRSHRATQTGYNLQRFISVLRIRQAVISQNLQRDGTPKHELVGSGQGLDDPNQLADLIRQEIGYDIEQKPQEQDHLKYLRERLHDKYIYVFKTMSTPRDIIEVAEMRGMYLHDDYAPCIAINRRDYKNAQVFTLAHEIAHLFRAGEKIDSIEFRDFDNVDDPEETLCNRVAARLLIPNERIGNQPRWSIDDVKDLAQKSQVSSLVSLYRLADAGRIDRQTTKEFSKQLGREYEQRQKDKADKGSRQDSGGNYHHNMRDSNGSLFSEIVFSLYQDNRIGVAEAQNLLKMAIDEI